MAKRDSSRPAKTKAGANVAARPPLRLEWRSPAELTENPANWRRHPGGAE